jgi:hypothetical protein
MDISPLSLLHQSAIILKTFKMRLSKIVILALKGMNRDERKTLAETMGITEDTLYRWIRTNDEKFTMAGHLLVLQKTFGLEMPQLLLEEVQDTTVAA